MVFSLESAVWFGFESICTGDRTRGGRNGCEMGEWTGELNIYRHQTIFERQKPQSRPKLDPHWATTVEATFNPCSRLHFTFCLGKVFESLMFAFSSLLRSSKTMNLCSKCFAGESNLEAFCWSDRPHRVGCNVLTQRPTNDAAVVVVKPIADAPVAQMADGRFCLIYSKVSLHQHVCLLVATLAHNSSFIKLRHHMTDLIYNGHKDVKRGM